jgi:hypothetical protein
MEEPQLANQIKQVNAKCNPIREFLMNTSKYKGP